MESSERCPGCGRALSPGAPQGLCSRCLLAGVLPGADIAANSVADPGDPTRDRSAPELLRYFGDYELLDRAGAGGMGIVFKARQRSLNRVVAVKLIRSGHFAGELERRRFLQEAQLAAALQHPGIVSIHEV